MRARDSAQAVVHVQKAPGLLACFLSGLDATNAIRETACQASAAGNVSNSQRVGKATAGGSVTRGEGLETDSGEGALRT